MCATLARVDETRVDEAALKLQDLILRGAVVIAALTQQHLPPACTIRAGERKMRRLKNDCAEIGDVEAVNRRQRRRLIAHGVNGIIGRQCSFIFALHHLLDRRAGRQTEQRPRRRWLVVAIVDNKKLLVRKAPPELGAQLSVVNACQASRRKYSCISGSAPGPAPRTSTSGIADSRIEAVALVG